MTHAKTRAATLVAAPLLVLLLSSCMSTGTAGTAAPGAGSDPNSSSSTKASASASTADTEASFGQTITYDDGLAVTVTDKGTFKPSDYASKEKAKSYRKFQITLKNGSQEKFDPTLVSPTLQDGEADASPVFDTDKKIENSPQTKLRPGKTVKWLVAFGVDSDDLTMDVALNDFKHDDATFVSK